MAVRDIQAGDQDTTLFSGVDEVNSGGCSAPLNVETGSIVVNVRLSFRSFEAGADSCAKAEEVAVLLEPLLPD